MVFTAIRLTERCWLALTRLENHLADACVRRPGLHSTYSQNRGTLTGAYTAQPALADATSAVPRICISHDWHSG